MTSGGIPGGGASGPGGGSVGSDPRDQRKTPPSASSLLSRRRRFGDILARILTTQSPCPLQRAVRWGAALAASLLLLVVEVVGTSGDGDAEHAEEKVGAETSSILDGLLLDVLIADLGHLDGPFRSGMLSLL